MVSDSIIQAVYQFMYIATYQVSNIACHTKEKNAEESF